MEFTERYYFVTGTDTDCGKTYMTLQFMQSLKQSGKKVLGVKPIASGGEHTPVGLRNQDALLLQAASDFAPTDEMVNPFCFEAPVSPHIAAAKMGVRIDAATVAKRCLSADMSQYDHVFFEGAGGVHAPINEQETLLDVMQAFDIPVILVVGMRLGCLNHAILSYRALQAAGLKVTWVANPIDADMKCLSDNLSYLEAKL
jgi:dethiobiotin synthetase